MSKLFLNARMGLIFTVSTALTQSTPAEAQKVMVRLSNNLNIAVSSPEPIHQADEVFRWSTEIIIYSPGHEQAAVLFDLPIAKFGYSLVYLVGRTGKVQELPNSSVNQVVWSTDGKYVLGAGDNTLRIWNLSGKLRQIEFENIDGFVVHKNSVCVETSYFSQAGDRYRFIETLSLPALTLLDRSLVSATATCQAQP